MSGSIGQECSPNMSLHHSGNKFIRRCCPVCFDFYRSAPKTHCRQRDDAAARARPLQSRAEDRQITRSPRREIARNSTVATLDGALPVRCAGRVRRLPFSDGVAERAAFRPGASPQQIPTQRSSCQTRGGLEAEDGGIRIPSLGARHRGRTPRI